MQATYTVSQKLRAYFSLPRLAESLSASASRELSVNFHLEAKANLLSIGPQRSR